MRPIREACAVIWKRLNPSEPGPGFLAILMGSALGLFLIAYLIGQL